MPLGEKPVAYELLYLLGKIEKAKQVCHCGAISSDCFAYLHLGKPKFMNESTVALSLFDGIQVLALQVLDECQAQRLGVTAFADEGWNRSPA